MSTRPRNARRMAIPDLRGDGRGAKLLMGVFNQTLWSDLQGSGHSRAWSPKTLYPEDHSAAARRIVASRRRAGDAAARGCGETSSAPTGGGLVDERLVQSTGLSANYLAFCTPLRKTAC